MLVFPRPDGCSLTNLPIDLRSLVALFRVAKRYGAVPGYANAE